jgi:hypothetical protein
MNAAEQYKKAYRAVRTADYAWYYDVREVVAQVAPNILAAARRSRLAFINAEIDQQNQARALKFRLRGKRFLLRWKKARREQHLQHKSKPERGGNPAPVASQ